MHRPFMHPSSGTFPPSVERIAQLKRLMEKHPYWSAFFLFLSFHLVFLSLHTSFGLVMQKTSLPALTRNLLGEGLLALVVALPIPPHSSRDYVS